MLQMQFILAFACEYIKILYIILIIIIILLLVIIYYRVTLMQKPTIRMLLANSLIILWMQLIAGFVPVKVENALCVVVHTWRL